MKKITLILSALLLGVLSFGQNAEKCATIQLLQQRIQTNPVYQKAYTDFRKENQAQSDIYLQNIANGVQQKTTQTNYVIPVVFHVVLTQPKLNQLGGTSGVRDRMLSQLDAINKDYNAKNTDSTSIPSPFKPLFGNAGILFAPAHRKPDNTSTEGFDIVLTTISSFSINNHYGSDPKFSGYGGVDAWDPTKYLNIWVVDITENTLLGYTIPPSFINYGFQETEFGVVIDYGNFGKRASMSQYFNPSTNDLGRTLTHEVGHFFELEHTFGQDSTCSGTGDDGIADTPPQSDATYNTTSACPNFPKFDICSPTGNGIMWMNFMDYVDDKCMYLFTKQQVNRMRSQFVPSGIPLSLTQSLEVLNWPNGIATTPTESQVELFPNPTKGKFDINLMNIEGLEQITIINTLGQMVYHYSNCSEKHYEIDFTAQPKGIYLIQYQYKAGNKTQKIVLE